MAKRNKRQYHELNEFTDDRQLYIVNGRYDNIKKQAGLKLNEIHPKTGECPDCITKETRIITEEEIEEKVVVAKRDVPFHFEKRKSSKKRTKWVCVVGPCDF